MTKADRQARMEEIRGEVQQARESGWGLKGAHRDEDICPVCVERGG